MQGTAQAYDVADAAILVVRLNPALVLAFKVGNGQLGGGPARRGPEIGACEGLEPWAQENLVGTLRAARTADNNHKC